MTKRTALLAGAGLALVALFAFLPAPKLIFRRSPIVSARAPGDVRRVVMAVERSGIVHAVLETWIGSNWALEYWTSVPALTPRALVITHDLLQNSDARLVLHASRLWLGWVSHDLNTGTYALHLTSHRDDASHHDRGFPAPETIATSTKQIQLFALIFDSSADKPVLSYSVGRDSFGPACCTQTVSTTLPAPPKGATVVYPPGSDDVYAYKLDGRVALVRKTGTTTLASRLGCCPSLAEDPKNLWVSWIMERTANPIHHYVEVAYFGSAKRFTTGGIIPVTALTKQPIHS